jgi:hypothetical protein
MNDRDIYADLHARRRAIDWSRVHITSDSRAPIGPRPRLRPESSLLGRVLAMVRV